MSETQTQTANPETTTSNPATQVPNVPDPIIAQIDKVTEALARRIEGAPKKEVDWKGVAEFGMKTAIVVGGIAAATTAVVLITKAAGSSDVDLPSPSAG